LIITRPRRPGVESPRRRERAPAVVGQQGRDLQRHPAVHALGPLAPGTKEVRRAPHVLERQLEEQLLAPFPCWTLRPIAASWAWLCVIACSKMVEFDVSPVIDSSSM
jgi:hypothetical protein